MRENPDTRRTIPVGAKVHRWTAPDGWQLRAYVKNITNTHYASYLVNGGVAGIVRYVPRDDVRYGGVTLRKTF